MLPRSIASLQTQTSNLVKTSLPSAKLLKILGELVEPNLTSIVPDIMKGKLILLEPLSGTCCAVLPISKNVTRWSQRLKRKVRYTAPAALFWRISIRISASRIQPSGRSVHGRVKSPQVVIANLSGGQDQPRVTAIHSNENQGGYRSGGSSYPAS